MVGTGIAFALAALLSSALAAPAPLLARQSSDSTASNSSSYAVFPEFDSFYHSDISTLSSTAPGTVLGSRRVNTTFSALAATGNQTIEAYQVSYVTSSPEGSTLTAVTTVLVPTGPKRANQLIAYSLPEDSSFIDCAPSYSFLTAADPNKTNPVFAGEEPLIAALLIKGFTVTSSDYETNEIAGFGSGPLFARGVLDGIRATLNFNSSGLDPNATKIGLMGYSGGSIATTWAVATAPTYASELNIIGFSTGGTPANISANTIYLDGTAGSGFNFIGLAGLSKTYSSLKQYLSGVLTATGFKAVYYASRECLYNVLAAYAGVSIASSNYTTAGDRLFYAGPVQEVYKQLTLGTNKTLTPTVGGYAAACTVDTTVPFFVQAAGWRDLCANGLPSLEFQIDNSTRCAHADEWIRAFPSALAALLARFNGTAAAQGCTNQTFTTARVPSADALGQNVTTLFSAVLASYKVTNATASASSSMASGSSTASVSMSSSASSSAASATSTA